MSAATLGGLIGTLVAARHAGGDRYDFPERVLRQFAGHCRQEGYADGSIVKEAVEEFLYGRHLKASTIRREEIVLRELAEHARQFGWHAWAPPALTAVKKPHRPPPYVFSDEEIRRLFRVIDTQPLSENSNRALVDPVLFRVFCVLSGSPQCRVMLHQMPRRRLLQHISAGVVFVVAAGLTPVVPGNSRSRNTCGETSRILRVADLDVP